VPWAKLFNNNVRISMGRGDDKRWNRILRDMIVTGRAKPSQIVSHRLSLDESPCEAMIRVPSINFTFKTAPLRTSSCDFAVMSSEVNGKYYEAMKD
jgi:hypothetical protein